MATVDLIEFLPDVLPEVPGCPEPTAINALRSAATRLCQFAPVWQHEPPMFTVTPGTAEYSLAAVGQLPSYGRVVRLIAPIKVNNEARHLYPTPRERLDYTSAGWQQQTGPAIQTYFMLTQSTLRVVPIPDDTCTDQLSLRFWMRPTDDAGQIDESLLLEYRMAIADGAKFRLMSMPKQPWSDPAMAAFYGRQFNGTLRLAYAAASKDYTDANLSVQMRPWR